LQLSSAERGRAFGPLRGGVLSGYALREMSFESFLLIKI